MTSGLICAWGSKPLSAPPENYDQASFKQKGHIPECH
jgi:hypothetical protein